MLNDMLSALMPNARERVEDVKPWLFDEDSSADLALLHAIGVLGSMREAELALFFRGSLRAACTQGYDDELTVDFPASNGSGSVTYESAAHATRRRLQRMLKDGFVAAATAERTTSDHLAGRYYWLTTKGTRRVRDAGYLVGRRQRIDNMAHIGSVQDQHRLLEQQYIIARRLINREVRVWGEYAIRSGLARQPVLKRSAATPATIKKRLTALSDDLFVPANELGDVGTPDTEAGRRYFTRRPDVLLLDEQAERERRWDASAGSTSATQLHAFGDIDWTEIEASKKDAVTQAKSFNGIFYLGRMLDDTLERGLVTKVTLVTRRHPHTDLRAKLLDAYERWLTQSDVRAMLQKKARLTPGFDPERISEQVWVAELTQDSEHRLTSFSMESIASIFLRNRRG